MSLFWPQSVHGLIVYLPFVVQITSQTCAVLPPVGPTDLPLSLLEMGCSGRFELITHPLPGDQPLPPQSTVSTHQIFTSDSLTAACDELHVLHKAVSWAICLVFFTIGW